MHKMHKELQRKVTEEKPSYSREEIQWLPLQKFETNLFLRV